MKRNINKLIFQLLYIIIIIIFGFDLYCNTQEAIIESVNAAKIGYISKTVISLHVIWSKSNICFF